METPSNMSQSNEYDPSTKKSITEQKMKFDILEPVDLQHQGYIYPYFAHSYF